MASVVNYDPASDSVSQHGRYRSPGRVIEVAPMYKPTYPRTDSQTISTTHIMGSSGYRPAVTDIHGPIQPQNLFEYSIV